MMGWCPLLVLQLLLDSFQAGVHAVPVILVVGENLRQGHDRPRTRALAHGTEREDRRRQSLAPCLDVRPAVAGVTDPPREGACRRAALAVLGVHVGAAVSAAPRPDEYALAASDEPSERRARRSIQDNEAEASQDDGDWDPA